MKILYICTHNRCRSILSEAITLIVAEQQSRMASSRRRVQAVNPVEKSTRCRSSILRRLAYQHLEFDENNRYSERVESAEQLMQRVNQRSL